MLELAEDAAAVLDDAVAATGREARARSLETVGCALLAWVEAGWALADRIEAGALIGARLDARARQHAATAVRDRPGGRVPFLSGRSGKRKTPGAGMAPGVLPSRPRPCG